MQTILACIDFSDTSGPVLDQTRTLAQSTGARVVLLHVDQPPREYLGLDVGYLPTTAPPALEHRPNYQKLLTTVEDLRQTGIEVEMIYEEGLVVECILDHAGRTQADMLLLGSHGHGALYHFMMGSMTEGVLRHAERPVLVVPAPKKQKVTKAGPSHTPSVAGPL